MGMSQPPPGINSQQNRVPQGDAVDPLMPPGAAPPPPTTEPVPTALPVTPESEFPTPINPDPVSPNRVGPPPVAPAAQPPPTTSPVAGQVARPILVAPSTTGEIHVDTEVSEGWEGDEEYSDVLEKAQRAAPPWVVSLLVHTIILVVLGLL